MTPEEEKLVESEDRMRSLSIEANQLLQAGQLEDAHEAMALIEKRSQELASHPCRRERLRYRWCREYSAKVAPVLVLLMGRRTKTGMEKRKTTWRVLFRAWWIVVVFWVRVRILLPLVPCKCPKDEEDGHEAR